MGFTQWALASTRPPYLKAMAVALCGSVRRFAWYPGGSYALEIIIPWDMGAVNFNKPTGRRPRVDTSPRRDREAHGDARSRASTTFRSGDAIKFLSGEDLPLFTQQLAHGDPDDPFWAPLDFSSMLADVGRARPSSSTAGRTTSARRCSTTTSRSVPAAPRSGSGSAPAATSGVAAKAG